MKRTIVIVNIAVAVALSIAQTPAIAQGPTPEQEAALRQIEAFSNGQAKSDPHHPAVEAELLGRIDEMVNTQPPAAWAPSVRRWYFSVSARLHSEERARIRSIERAAAGGIVSPSPAAPDKLLDRMKALENDLLAGKLGPREHALHVLEAARAIFPADANLIDLREARVVVATAYELGHITIEQLNDIWARARAGYQQNADTHNQRILDEVRADHATRRAAVVDSFQQFQARQRAEEAARSARLNDLLRQRREINCTSATLSGTTTTTCR